MNLEHEVILTLPDNENYLLAKSLRFKYLNDRIEWCRDNVSNGHWGVVGLVLNTCIFAFKRAEDA